MRYRVQLLGLVLIVMSFLSGFHGVIPVMAQSEEVVQVVYFYSPTCPHCNVVKAEVLPPLEARYGESLEIAHLDTSLPQGQALWQAAVERYEPSLIGVPMIVIGDKVLVGSLEIPQQLPIYIEQYLLAGGVGWPDLPGIETAVADLASPVNDTATLRTRFMRDPLGNSVSVVVLVALLISIVLVIRPRRWQQRLTTRLPNWAMLVVLTIGLAAAIYLSYVDTTGAEAFCGPVGDCNTVQQSEYAFIFGFLPLAVVGVIGYLSIMGVYVYNTWIRPDSDLLHAATFLMSFFGLGVSVFLTYLQPFVIGATCAWCLTSALCMMADTLMSAGKGWPAVERRLPFLALLVAPAGRSGARRARYARRRRSARRFR